MPQLLLRRAEVLQRHPVFDLRDALICRLAPTLRVGFSRFRDVVLVPDLSVGRVDVDVAGRDLLRETAQDLGQHIGVGVG